MSKIGDVLGSLVDNIDSSIDLSTSRNRNTVTVETARAQSLLTQAQNDEMRLIREQQRKDKMLSTATDILFILVALGALGFAGWLILYIKNNK